MKTLHWRAICQYEGKKKFSFTSSEFVVDSYSDLEKVGREIVEREWAEISPHPAPKIIDFECGHTYWIPDEDAKR